jgi:hypothetical protein
MQRVVFAVLVPPRSEGNPHATPRVIERFVFEICIMPTPNNTAAGTATAAAAQSTSPAAAAPAPLPAVTLAALHTEFAAVLLRLAACGGHFTAKRPADCTWTVLLYTSQPTPAGPPAASPLVRHPDAPALKWAPVSLLHASGASGGATGSAAVGTPFLDWPVGRSHVMSIRSVRLACLHMEVYAEAEAEE